MATVNRRCVKAYCIKYTGDIQGETVRQYNPFDKPFNSVGAEDIWELNNPEGYFLDYKQEFVERAEIARTISSFANTYGGILLFGIEEDNENNTPEDWFLLPDKRNPKEKIREIVQTRVDPVPDFSSYWINGYDNDGEEGYVLLVTVPESNLVPHITNDGCIYQRDGETTTEITEADALNRLYRRRERWEQTIEQFCEMAIAHTVQQPSLEIYSIPTTFEQNTCKDVINEFDKFKGLMNIASFTVECSRNGGTIKKNGEEKGIRFTSYRTTSDGVVAQGWEKGVNTKIAPTTVTFLTNGALKVFLPIPQGNFQSDIGSRIDRRLSGSRANNQGYSPESGVSKLLDSISEQINDADKQSNRETAYRKLNGSRLLSQLYRILNGYIRLLNRYNWTHEPTRKTVFRARYRELSNTVLALDCPAYKDYFRRDGIPLIKENSVEVPQIGKQTVYSTSLENGDVPEELFRFSSRLLQGLGVPPERFLSLVQDDNSQIQVFS